jgi:hypothetical protein
LALVVDELRLANWQRSGTKKRKRPKPISPLAAKTGVRHGRTDRSPVEVQAYLAALNPPEEVTRG